MDRDRTDSTSSPPAETDALIGRLRAENLALRRELEQLTTYRQLALRDPLTGLHNRRSFDECLRREWSRYRRCGVPFALLAIDLDDFKAINDSFGHAVGDGVLCWFARAMERVCRELDVVCRVGGDEFVILLPATGHAGARTMGRRLTAAIERDEEAPKLPGHPTIGFSWGCGSTDQTDGPAEMLRVADESMYRRKRAHRLPGLVTCLPVSARALPWTILSARDVEAAILQQQRPVPEGDPGGPPAVA